MLHAALLDMLDEIRLFRELERDIRQTDVIGRRGQRARLQADAAHLAGDNLLGRIG